METIVSDNAGEKSRLISEIIHWSKSSDAHYIATREELEPYSVKELTDFLKDVKQGF